MTMLIAGLFIWVAVHLFSGVAPRARAGIIARIGEGPYKGLYSLLILASLVLIVLGWRGSPFVSVYAPPAWGHPVAMASMLPALALIVAADIPGNHLRRWLRHPMLLGTALWSAAHLLANGDQRSVILFGALGGWALAEILLINRRDGPRPAPPPASWSRTGLWVVASIAAYLLLGWLHRWFAGVAVFQG